MENLSNSFDITGNNFIKLSFEELNSVIDIIKTKNITDEYIKTTISSICEIVLDGHVSISKCAQLCLKLSDAYKSTFEHKKQNQFKILLLAHCREMFEKQKANFFRIYYIPQDDKQNRNETEEMTKLRLQPVTTTMFFAELYIVGIMSCKVMEYFMKVFLDPVYINKVTLECFCLLILKAKEKYCQKNGKGLLLEMINRVENNCNFLKEHSCTKAKDLFHEVVEFIKDQFPQVQKESEISIENNTVAVHNNDIDYNAPVYFLKNINFESTEEITNVLSLIFNNLRVEPSFATFYANACYKTFNGTLSVEIIQNILETLINQNMESAHNDLLVIRNEQFEDLDIAKRIIGLVNFITEFFKVGFLSPKHVHSHIQKLLDTNLICDCSCHLTCIIMISCGDKLHCENYNLDVIQSLMVKLRQFCDNIKISSKTRFMVQKLNKLQKHWKIIVANLNVGDQAHYQIDKMETDQKFRSIMESLTATNIDEILFQIKILDFNKDTLKCLQYLFSMVEDNTELGRQYSDVCKEMKNGSTDKIMLKMHVEEISKVMVLKYVDERFNNKNDCTESVSSSASGIANFLGGLYSSDILSTDFMKDLFEILMDSQKACEAVLELTKMLLLTCGHDLNNKAGGMKMMIYTEWVENQSNKIQDDAHEKSMNLKQVKEQCLLTKTPDIKSLDLPIYSHVLNTLYSMEFIAESFMDMEEQEFQQIVPKIDDITEFPPVLADIKKKKKKSQLKDTFKKMYNSPAVLNNPSIQKAKDVLEIPLDIADEILVKDELVENIPFNAICGISSSLLTVNRPLNSETSKYKECFNSNHEYDFEKKHLGKKLGSISSILDDFMMNNIKGELLDKCIIALLKNFVSDPSSTTEQVREISISFCNKPIKLHNMRNFILKRLIIVSWKKFSNTIFLANTQLGYDKLITLMDKIQRERKTESRKQLKAELEDALDLRNHAVTLVKFLGELVNFQIINPHIIQSIKSLLDICINTITVECFCEFFKTVGLRMETELGEVVMNECFLKLMNILTLFHTRSIIFCPSVSTLISEVLQLRLSLKLNKSKSL